MCAMPMTLASTSRVKEKPGGWQQYLLVFEQEAEAAHQPGEEWHTQACGFQNTGIQVCVHVQERKQGKIPIGGKREKLGEAQRESLKEVTRKTVPRTFAERIAKLKKSTGDG